MGSQIPSNVPSSTNSDIQGPRGRGPNIDRFHALTGIKFTSLPRVCRACTARGGRGRCPRPRPFFRSRGGALGRGFYTGGISSEFAPRSAVYENREGEEGGRESRKVAVISQNRQWQWGRLEIERINSRHAGYAALSLSNNRLFCPRHPLWDLLWKRFTNIISTATPSISESGVPLRLSTPSRTWV